MDSLGDKQEVGWHTEQPVWQLQLAGHRVSLPGRDGQSGPWHRFEEAGVYQEPLCLANSWLEKEPVWLSPGEHQETQRNILYQWPERGTKPGTLQKLLNKCTWNGSVARPWEMELLEQPCLEPGCHSPCCGEKAGHFPRGLGTPA